MMILLETKNIALFRLYELYQWESSESADQTSALRMDLQLLSHCQLPIQIRRRCIGCEEGHQASTTFPTPIIWLEGLSYQPEDHKTIYDVLEHYPQALHVRADCGKRPILQKLRHFFLPFCINGNLSVLARQTTKWMGECPKNKPPSQGQSRHKLWQAINFALVSEKLFLDSAHARRAT